MKNKKNIIILTIIILILFSFLIWNKNINNSTEDFPIISNECGIESCHGLDITCGPNVLKACDMMYIVGDGCRVFAKCEKVEGECKFIYSLEFENCKNCVEKCEKDYIDNPVDFFECERECIDTY